MKAYVGTKIVKARPMTEHQFNAHVDRPMKVSHIDRNGYLVQYPDGYESWSPKETFESAYREITPSEYKLIDG